MNQKSDRQTAEEKRTQLEIDAENLGNYLALIEALGCGKDIESGMDPQDAMLAVIAQMKENSADDDRLRESMSKILTDTANALKGPPAPLHAHSWHDLASVASALAARSAAVGCVIDDKGVERKELGTPEKTADGVVIHPGATVFYARPLHDGRVQIHEAWVDSVSENGVFFGGVEHFLNPPETVTSLRQCWSTREAAARSTLPKEPDRA